MNAIYPSRHLCLFLLPLCMLVMACSSQNDAPDMPDSSAIAFEVGDGATTRAGIGSTADMAGFDVWGWATDASGACTRVFNGQQVTFTGSAWTYSPPVFWMPNRDYRFVALTTNKTAGSGLTTTATNNFTTWEQSATIGLSLSAPYDEDVLCATHQQTTGESLKYVGRVKLSFSHILTRLKLQVQAAQIDGCTIRLRSVTFKPVNDACTFSPRLIETVHVWPPARPGGEPQYTTTYDVRIQTTSVTPTNASHHMLADNPQGHSMPRDLDYLYLVPGAPGSFLVNYEIWSNEPKIMIMSCTDEFRATMPLLSGNSYVATIILPSATNVVSLQPSLEPWGGDNDNDREILYI